ncbi:MAG: glycosyltransferase [Rickettsiales bacterium]|nr:glycosyltransferase [Rickettsiales bacterium]
MSHHQLKTIDGFVFNTKDISVNDDNERFLNITYDDFRKIVKQRYIACLLNSQKVTFVVKQLDCVDLKNVVGNILFVNNDTFSQILIDVYGDFIENFCQNTRSYAKINSKTLNYRTLTKVIFIFFSIFTLLSFLPLTNKIFYNIVCFYYIVVVFTKGFCLFVGCVLAVCDKYAKTNNKTKNIDDGECPIYTILVPMFKERRETILQMINGLNSLNYPKNKLDIKFVLEECDVNTRKVVNEIIETKKNNLPSGFLNIINVPKFPPQTKPKACNVASLFAFGDYIVIFDAEDIPSPNQLINSLSLFKEKQNDNLFCLQGNLCFYNYNTNILTSLFNIEYNIHFKLLLRAYSLLNITLPLGGTSNHFNFKSLERYCFWDSYNVTEDVEISSIIKQGENKITHLNSDTREWCVEDLKSWIKQRTRWMKGYLLTYYLFIVRDIMAVKNFNIHQLKSISLLCIIRRFFFKHIIVGSQVMVFLLSPFLLKILLFVNVEYEYYNTLITISALIYLLSIIWYIFLIKREHKKISKIVILSCFMYPFYFILHIITSYIALVDLIKRPFYWAKTEHKC